MIYIPYILWYSLYTHSIFLLLWQNRAFKLHEEDSPYETKVAIEERKRNRNNKQLVILENVIKEKIMGWILCPNLGLSSSLFVTIKFAT